MSIIHFAYKVYFIILFAISIYYWIERTFWQGILFLVFGTVGFIIQGVIVSLITVLVRKIRQLLGVDAYFIEPESSPTLFDIIFIICALILSFIGCVYLNDYVYQLIYNE